MEVLNYIVGKSSRVHGSKLDYMGREPRTWLSGPQEFRMQEKEEEGSGKDFKEKKPGP